MEKVYDKITFANGTTPALNETNLNLISEAIDEIDDRVCELTDTSADVERMKGKEAKWDSTLSQAEEYSDTNKFEAITLSESYADKKDAETLNSAKTYTYEQVRDAVGEARSYSDLNLSKAKSYSDTQDETTLTSAKDYADTQDEATITSAKGYTDTSVETETERAMVAENARIKKFYTSNLQADVMNDCDEGAIRNLKIYGRSEQGDSPSPENPQDIHLLEKPRVTLNGKNLVDINSFVASRSAVTITVDGDTITVSASDGGKYSQGRTDVYLRPNTEYKLTGHCDSYDVTNRIGVRIYDYESQAYISTLFASFAPNADGYYTGTLTTGDSDRYSLSIFSTYSATVEAGLGTTMISNLMLEEAETATDYEPYAGCQSVVLERTLRAIPVSAGGNVTINGQRYYADYIDVEAKRLVRMIGILDSSKIGYGSTNNMGYWSASKCGYSTFANQPILLYGAVEFSALSKSSATGASQVQPGEWYLNSNNLYINHDGFTTADEYKEWLDSGVVGLYLLSEPTYEDLTDDEVNALMSLRTYYGTTTAIITSEDIDSVGEFLYPVSLEKGWEYVKEQIGDTSETIYNLQDISDSALISAQYAEILAEMALDE